MAAPTVRTPQGVVNSGGTADQSSGTQAGDLLVAFVIAASGGSQPVWSFTNGFTQRGDQVQLDAGGIFLTGGVGTRIAAVAGAATHTPSTSAHTYILGHILSVAGGDESGIVVPTGTWSGSAGSEPDPPAITLGATRDWLVAVMGGWGFTANVDVTPSVPSLYTLNGLFTGSYRIELGVATRAMLAAASEDPGAFSGGGGLIDGTLGMTVGIPNALAAAGGWGIPIR